MAVKKVGELIKEARAKSGLSQSALAKLAGVSAADIGKAERCEKDLSSEALKAIAKATGVTQKSLLEAPKNVAAAKTAAAAKKTTTTTAAKKTTTAAAKKTAATAKKTAAAELTGAEKSMLNAWRKADDEARSLALKILKGENEAVVSWLLQKFTANAGANGGPLSGIMGMLGNLGKK